MGRRVVLLAAAFLSGCGSGGATTTKRPCTLATCTSGASLTAAALPPGAASVELCVGARCTRSPVTGTPFAMEIVLRDLDDSSPRTVVARVLDGKGGTLTESSLRRRPVRIQPNGPGCRPTCYRIATRLTRDGRLLPA